MAMLSRKSLALLSDTMQLTKYSVVNTVPGNLINAPALCATTASVMTVKFSEAPTHVAVVRSGVAGGNK
jgi:hypothetical protein